MKVYLRKGHHSAYDDLVVHPPQGVEYSYPRFVSASESKAVDGIKKRLFSAYLRAFNKPHSIYVNSGDAKLIHACSGIMIRNKKPWVIDTEHVASFAGFEAGRLEKVRPEVERLLSSKWCRRIMPWSEAAKASIINGLDASGFKDKIEVVYPAMAPVKQGKEKHEGTNLLFVSKRFYTKGGKEVLAAYDKLKGGHDLKLTVISDVPEELKRRHPDVAFFEPNIPRSELLSGFFPKSDIFILPSYMDTFGMVFLEAMGSGIPVISTNVFAIPEILGKAGICIDASKFSWYGRDGLFAWKSWDAFEDFCERGEKPDVVKHLAGAILRLVEDSKLRRRMGCAGAKDTGTGRFSINHRNRQLKRIYEEAAKV